jgi:hypothetical protein
MAFRHARHTEVYFLFKVQGIDFCRLRSVSRNKSHNKEPNVDERIPSARIFANLMLGVRATIEFSAYINVVSNNSRNSIATMADE